MNAAQRASVVAEERDLFARQDRVWPDDHPARPAGSVIVRLRNRATGRATLRGIAPNGEIDTDVGSAG